MVQHLSPRDFDKEARQPQLTLVTSEMSGTAPEDQPETIGSALRRARLARGAKSLESIADDIRIRPHLLQALENDDYDQMPGVIYAAGFLRTYADYLGLDPAPLVERLKQLCAAPQKETALVFPEPINDPRIPRRPLVALAVLLCLAIYGAWYAFSRSDDDLAEVPAPGRDITGMTTAAPEPVADAAPQAAPEPTPVPAPIAAETTPALTAPPAPASLSTPPVAAAGQMLLYATAESWIQVTDSEQKRIAERLLKPGESYAVPVAAGYRLLAGNAGGLMIELDGRRYGPLGSAGDVRRNFALSPESVQSLPPAP